MKVQAKRIKVTIRLSVHLALIELFLEGNDEPLAWIVYGAFGGDHLMKVFPYTRGKKVQEAVEGFFSRKANKEIPTTELEEGFMKTNDWLVRISDIHHDHRDPLPVELPEGLSLMLCLSERRAEA